MSERPAPHLKDSEANAYFRAINKEVALARILSQPVSLTWFVLAANIILYIGAWTFGEFLLHQHYNFEAWALNVGQLAFYTGMKLPEQTLEQHQWWRLLTSAFVHMDITHILFNGYGLYTIGPLIERFYGKARWIIFYFGSAILSALASLLLNDAVSGGASGALYGLVGVMLVLGFKYRSALPDRVSRALPRGMLPWVVFGIGIGFFDFMPMDNAAHIGGLLSGMVMALMTKSKLSQHGSRAHQQGAPPVLKFMAALLLILSSVSAFFWAKEVHTCTESKSAYLQCYPEIASEVTLSRDAYMRSNPQ